VAVLAAMLTPVLLGGGSAGATGTREAPGALLDARAPGAHYAIAVPMCATATRGRRTCFAMRRELVSPDTPGAIRYVESATPAPGPAGGLTPAELASAYGYSTAGGTGQTVGIVDAYNDPNIAADLTTFDSNYGLLACTVANGCLEVVNQTGQTSPLPPDDTTGWSAEETLDVETVHSVCPHCHILLVETDDETNANLDAGVDEAVKLGAKEVSNSYGSPETGATAADEAAYNHPGVVITASTGDDGWEGWDRVNQSGTPDGVPSFPASLNTVVAVGGTSLDLNQSGGRASETVWNDNGPQDIYGANLGLTGATGGACSTLFTAQPWQLHVRDYAATTCGTKRLDADVAAVGDALTGFDIYDSYDYTGSGNPYLWITVGGTSLASPIIAAMYALAGGANGAKYPSLYLYGHLGTPALYDVTAGGNGFCDGETAGDCGIGNPNALGFGMVDCDYTNTDSPGTPSSGTAQCDAAPGYDGPSGVGTPVGLSAFEPAQFGTITLPAKIVAGTTASFSASKSIDPYPGGAIVNWTWLWGDGTVASPGVSPTHKYAKAGTYTLELVLSDSYGPKSVVTAKISVAA
jgi:hypothetical protein